MDHWRCPLARFGAAVLRTETEPPVDTHWDGKASQWPIGSATGFIPGLEHVHFGDLGQEPSHVRVMQAVPFLAGYQTYEDLNRALNAMAK